MSNKNYALITGASQGLGKAFAFECAERQIKMVLVALPHSGLYELADFIKKNYSVKTICIEKDLSSEKNCIELYNEIKDWGISIFMLINNAGIGGTYLFDERDPDYFESLINVNILAPTVITRLFINDLEQNSPSYILNVGSLSSYFYIPMKQVYAATKSFLFSFTGSLKNELASKGIHVSIVCPGGMNTNIQTLINNRSGTWLARQSIMDPEDVAAVAMRGLFKGKGVIIPGGWNRFFLFLDWALPVFLKNFIIRLHMQSLRANHKRSTELSVSVKQVSPAVNQLAFANSQPTVYLR